MMSAMDAQSGDIALLPSLLLFGLLLLE